jgi:hypothetical protein
MTIPDSTRKQLLHIATQALHELLKDDSVDEGIRLHLDWAQTTLLDLYERLETVKC